MATPRTKNSLDASRGGRARANILTAEERRTIARQAARARWAKAGKIAPSDPEYTDVVEFPEVTDLPVDGEPPYSMFRGNVSIADLEIECHVLSDLRRVLTQREMVRVMSGGRDSGDLARYLKGNPLYEPGAFDTKVIRFKVPGTQLPAHGYEAELLIEICDLYLRARDAKLLKRNQLPMAQVAEVIIRACAKVGIIALVDEATGYEKVRAKRSLQLKLQALIAEDMQEWAKLFPDDFWYELARLEGVHYSPRHRPLRWGKYVMRFVYEAVDPDVADVLREVNPNPSHGRNHHQWLKEHGRQRVNDQIQQVVAVMKMCDDMPAFRRAFERVFKKGPLQLELDLL